MEGKRTENFNSNYKLQPLSKVLQDVENNFRRNGSLYDANQAYYQQRLIKLRELRNAGISWDQIKEELQFWLWGRISNYFTNCWQILILMVLSNPFFALIYSIKGNLTRKTSPKRQITRIFKVIPITNPQDFIETGDFLVPKTDFRRRYMRALRLSTILMWKVGPADTSISGNIIDAFYGSSVFWAIIFLLCYLSL